MKNNTLKLRFDLLTESQRQIFLKLKEIAPGGVLGGGTAIMLLAGHRKSFDFDVFLAQPLKKQLLLSVKALFGKKLERPLVDSVDELSLQISQNTKISFIHFPFKPLYKTIFTDSIPLFAKEDLASNKAYAIGRRGVWRDYVDLFYLLKNGLKFEKVVRDAQKRFGGTFSEKLFFEQLTYFGDISDFTIEYIGEEHTISEIQGYFRQLVKKLLHF